MKSMIEKITEYINEEIGREKEIIKEEPAFSHIGTMAGGALDAYHRLLEFMKEESQ